MAEASRVQAPLRLDHDFHLEAKLYASALGLSFNELATIALDEKLAKLSRSKTFKKKLDVKIKELGALGE